MPDIITEYLSLDATGAQAGAADYIRALEEVDAKTKQAGKQNPFKNQTENFISLNKQVRAIGVNFGQAVSGPNALKNAIASVSGQIISFGTNQAKAIKSGDWSGLASQIQRVTDLIDDTNDKLDKVPAQANPIEAGFARVGESIKRAFTVTGVLYLIDKLVEIGKTLLDVTGTGEKYQSQFTRIFEGNGQAAAGYLATLQKVADTTNLTFEQLTDNSAKLASRGIIPSKDELLKLGDAANFINKDFTQLNEAILDANNSERWKELGFTVKNQGDKMTLSYGDFNKTVDNSVKGAYEAIQAFSKQGKVFGSTAEAGQQLSGKVSTLSDGVVGFFRTLGQGNSGVLHFFVDLLTSAVGVATNLVKALQPVANAIGSTFGAIGKAIGGVFTSFSNFDTQAEKTATTAQKVGYYFTKFVLDPFLLVINTTAQLIESFNLIVLAGELAVAKLSGNKGLAATINQQLNESSKRLYQLRTEFGRTFDDMGGNLETYVKRDNQRQRREDRRSRLAEEAYEGFKPTPTKPGATGPTDAEKKAAAEAQKQREQLLDNRKKLEDELVKLQEQYDKGRLESLDKNSEEYLELKRKYDLRELEQLRQHLIKVGQVGTGHYALNVKTGKKDFVENKDYKLPSYAEDILDKMAERIREQTSPDLYEANTKKLTDLIKSDFTEKLEKDDQARQKKYADMDLDNRKKLVVEADKITRQAGESEVDYERRKAEQLLQIKIDYYKEVLKLMKNDSFADQSAIVGLEEAIQSAQSQLSQLKKEGKNGPQNLFELLGFSFKDKDNNDITDQVEKQVVQATNTAIGLANDVLNTQIANDQARIDSINQAMEAKQREVDIEFELQKQGLGNNLQIKQQEYNALKAAREKELADQQRAKDIQLTINAAIQASEIAVAVAKIFKADAGIPLIGLIAAGVEVAALLVAFKTTVSQIGNSIPRYHTGGEITQQSNRTASGALRPGEIDIRAQEGEFMVQGRSYQPNKGLFAHLNTIQRPFVMDDFAAYVRDNPFEMIPEERTRGQELVNKQYEIQVAAAQPDYKLHEHMVEVKGHLKELTKITEDGQYPKLVEMPNGDILFHKDKNTCENLGKRRR